MWVLALSARWLPEGDDLLGAESSLINFTASPRQKTGGSNSPVQAALMESAVTKEQSVLCPPGGTLFSREASGSGGREFLRSTKRGVWHDSLLVEQMTLRR